MLNGPWFVNASLMNDAYELVHKPIVVELPVTAGRPSTSQVREIRIDEPIEGLAELYEHDRRRYVRPKAEEILGLAGRMIGSSKTLYRRANPDHAVVFNANVCTRERGKIWFGDLDLTEDESRLAELARLFEEAIYVLYEPGARFGNEDTPELDDYVVIVNADGTVVSRTGIVRAADGTLRRHESHA